MHLQELITHCTSEVRGLTPSDVPLARLTQAQLDALPVPVEQIEDLYPMTPLQQGLIFHGLRDLHGGAYVNQLRVDIEELEAERFKAAWSAIIERHDVLRTGFFGLGELSLQCVYRHVVPSFLERDWRDCKESAAELQGLAQSQRMEPFNLAIPPLMRFALIRVQDSRYHFIWTHHHLLTDGWSTAQVIGEVLQHYHTQNAPPRIGRYRDYIGWLQSRDQRASAHYWKVLLGSLEEASHLVSALRVEEGERGYASTSSASMPKAHCVCRNSPDESGSR